MIKKYGITALKGYPMPICKVNSNFLSLSLSLIYRRKKITRFPLHLISKERSVQITIYGN